MRQDIREAKKSGKGRSGRRQYDKNEYTEFHCSIENVERIWMQLLEFSIPACGIAGGEGLNKILSYQSYFNIFSRSFKIRF